MSIDNLAQLKSITQDLGYEVKQYKIEDGYELDALELDVEDHKELIILSQFADEGELDGSNFFQFYSEYTFNANEYDRLSLLTKINEVNPNLALGNFAFSVERGVIYFKYVWVLDKESKLAEDCIADILDMVEYAITEFREQFISLEL